MNKVATCAQRIQSGLVMKNWKQADLCASTGIPKSAMSQYCSGAFLPKQNRIAAIAEALNVNEAWLMGYDVSIERSDLDSEKIVSFISTASVRFLGDVAAGYDHTPTEEYEYMTIPTEWLCGRPASDFFALRVKGSSMYPEYRDGDEILCLHCSDMGHSGRVGVFAYGDGEITLKRIEYSKGKNWVDLVPINPEYERKRIEGPELDNCKVIGRTIRLIREIALP